MARSHVLLVLLTIGLWGSGLFADMVSISHWEQTTYYRHTFESDQARSGTLQITAAGDYILFFNGVQVAAGGEWRSAEEVAIDLESGDNHIAVAVTNIAAEANNGLLLSLQAGPQIALTSFSDENALWYWSGQEQTDSDWTSQNVGNTWNRVQAGTIDRTQVQGGIFHPNSEVVAGYPNQVNLGSSVAGRIVLADQRGQNIALGLNATELGVTDGTIGTPVWSLPQGLGALNRLVDITLPDLTQINRVRVITKPPDGNETFAGNSLIGYSVQISEDQSRWIEMGGINDIEEYAFTEVSFNPVLARYVRVQVTQVEVGSDPAKVAEIQIYGVDFAPSGTYVSPALDFSSSEAVKNFGQVRWWADVPPATQLSLQLSSGNSPDTTDASWSQWSEELVQSGAFFSAPEPRRYLRYRVNLKTDDLEITPALDSLEIDFSTEGIAARDASGSVFPNEAPMAVDTPFAYQLTMTMAAGDSVEKIRIHLPSFPSQVSSLQLLGQEVGAGTIGGEGVQLGGHLVRLTPGGVQDLDIEFDPPLTDQDGSEIPFGIAVHSALYTDTHEFRAFLFSPGSDNPQNIRQETAEGVSWEVVVTDVVKKTLLDVRAQPQVFTPNGDGINDFTVIEFALTKVTEPRRVEVEVFDLSGRRVRKLDIEPLIGGRYVDLLLGLEETRIVPGFWDGRNDAGTLVPVGIYLYTVKAHIDTGNETAAGTVSVVY